MKKVAIIILNWNGWKDTKECLSTLLKLQATCLAVRQASYKLQAIVVDNGSTDESVQKLKARFSTRRIGGEKTSDAVASSSKFKATAKNLKLKLIENKENLGFAEGNNIGIRYALKSGADYVILLNNDTLVDRDLVSKLLEVMEGDRTIGITAPKIYFAPGQEFHYQRYKESERGKVIWYAGGIIDWQNIYCSHRGVDEIDSGQYNRQEETEFASGCCMMIRKDVFPKIGLLDKKYYLYLEDVDFCVRARKAGFPIVYIPQAFLWHKNAESSGKPGSPLHLYYLTRNRLLFGMRYALLKTKLALLKESLRSLKDNEAKRKGVLDFYLRRFGNQWCQT